MQKHLVNIEFSVKTHKKQSRLTAQLQGAGGEMLVGCCPEQQSVTYQYREFPVPVVTKPVWEKIATGKKSWNQYWN